MDTLISVGAIVAAIILKLVFFLVTSRILLKRAPKKSEPYQVISKGSNVERSAKRILVTGGCGFLGSAIVRQLHERLGSRVSLVVLDTAIHAKFSPLLPSATYIRGDVCTYSHVRAASAGCACVVHSAGLLHSCLSDEAAFERVNFLGSRNVVEACLEGDLVALVYTSSGSVVFNDSIARAAGGGGSLAPIPESTAALPAAQLNGAYARSKAAAERRVLAANSHALHVVALRPGGVYGVGDTTLTGNILAGKPYVGPGDVQVPFVWVEDAARAHVDAVERLLFPQPGAPRIHGRAYHLAHDPVSDPLLYREFVGGPLVTPADRKSAEVRAAEAAAGVQDPLSAGVNAYGLRCNSPVPLPLIRVLAAVNEWVGRRFGVALLHPSMTPENMRYATNHWPLDVGEARRLLGWQPTPWRVVVARLGAQARAGKEEGGKGMKDKAA
ncbi:hypothetical protein Agub_g615 [Astrephomene gubernaculifera]|uniref:3-beta hydroxysteroid dehydrogenase/isomerase domain-containing protein n=1 Tax=Astrephomene gubernaculifera TaxID=47775 RepID=A0AAD3HGK8_9CHLO|nr:hypothetical protein Agub_g615 [Astrephomene gubernaculifera]